MPKRNQYKEKSKKNPTNSSHPNSLNEQKSMLILVSVAFAKIFSSPSLAGGLVIFISLNAFRVYLFSQPAVQLFHNNIDLMSQFAIVTKREKRKRQMKKKTLNFRTEKFKFQRKNLLQLNEKRKKNF
jgi:hypothetical protein